VNVRVRRHLRRRVVFLGGGWVSRKKGDEKYVATKTRGERLPDGTVRVGRSILVPNEYAKERIVAEEQFLGKDLTPEQRAAVEAVRGLYGKSFEPSYSFAERFVAPTPEVLATMPRVRAAAGMGADVLIPNPPEHPRGHFADFEKDGAELLAGEVRKLTGQPVAVTGGGGRGVYFGFVEGVRIIAYPPCLKGSNGRCLDNRDKVGSDADVWYVPDPAAKPEDILYGVEVRVRAFPGETIHDRLYFEPHLGSWRITALSGYGAENLRAEWPGGWE